MRNQINSAAEFYKELDTFIADHDINLHEDFIKEDTVSTKHGDVRVIVAYVKPKTGHNRPQFETYYVTENAIPVGFEASQAALYMELEIRSVIRQSEGTPN